MHDSCPFFLPSPPPPSLSFSGFLPQTFWKPTLLAFFSPPPPGLLGAMDAKKIYSPSLFSPLFPFFFFSFCPLWKKAKDPCPYLPFPLLFMIAFCFFFFFIPFYAPLRGNNRGLHLCFLLPFFLRPYFVAKKNGVSFFLSPHPLLFLGYRC